MTARINLNEALISRYYFYWTNFFYLPFFYFILFFVVSAFISITSSSWVVITFFFAFLGYSLELYQFLETNSSLDMLDNSSMFLNTLLTNPLNKYHPFLFYIMTLIIFIVVLSAIYLLKTSNVCYIEATILYRLTKYINSVFIWLLISLMMGGWWALQEGSWGGWWDWDPSEMLGLMFLLTVLALIHSLNTEVSFYRLANKAVCYILLTTLVFYLVQLNFEFVSHNFGIKSFFLFNNNMIFLEAFFLNYLLLTLHIKNINWGYTNYTPLRRLSYLSRLKIVDKSPTLNFNLLVSFLVFIYFWLSFLPLINYFSNNFWSLDIITIKSVIRTLNAYSFLFFILYFYTPANLSLVKSLPLLSTVSSWGWLTNLITTPRGFFYGIHALVQMFFLINLFLVDTIFSFWSNESYFTNALIIESFYTVAPISYSCNGRLIELTTRCQSSLETTLFSENLIFRTNTAELENFILLYSNERCLNIYHLVNSNYISGQLINYSGVQYLLLLFLIFKLTLLVL